MRQSNLIYLHERFPERQPLYLLYSDNFDGAVVSAIVLKELRLQMNTGDYTCHMAVPIAHSEALELTNMRQNNMLLTLADIG